MRKSLSTLVVVPLMLIAASPKMRIGYYGHAFFEGLSSSAWLALYVLLQRNGWSRVREVVRSDGPHAALTGIGMYAAYTLVLLSMAFVANVSYVAAFRQLSILLGAIFGVVILKEPRHVPKFVGVALMFLGLVLVATG